MPWRRCATLCVALGGRRDHAHQAGHAPLAGKLEKKHAGLRQIAVGRIRSQCRPALGKGLAQESEIRCLVDHEDDAVERHHVEKLVDLEHTALVLRLEAAQIHQHRIAVARQPRQHHLPAIVVAEEIVHAVTAIEIAALLCLRQPPRQHLGPRDEPPVKLPAQEVEEFVRLDRARGKVRPGDQADVARVAP